MDPDSSSGRNTGGSAARAGGIVDETRWAGGLEPTSLGRVYNPSGSAGYNHPQLQGYRRQIGKMKRVVDKWVEKEFERQVEAGKVAIQIKEKRKASSTNDNNNKNAEHEDEDWTEYGTNEHEDIARQRMEEISKANALLVSEKWSLDRALLLHGESHEISSQYTSFDPMTGEQPKDIQSERERMNKRMDTSQRKASADLYCAYKIIQQALKNLHLCENIIFNNEIMRVMCKFADTKGSFRVKGVATALPNGVKNDVLLCEKYYEYNKKRQMAALASATIFLECKKQGLGRSISEICSSFELPINCHNIDNLVSDVFISKKYLFNAKKEFESLLPDYVKSVSRPNVPSEKHTTSKSNSAKREQSIITNQIEYTTKKLNLPSIAAQIITKLVIHCKDNILSDQFIVGSKYNALIASVIYLVCDAAATMKRLSKAAINKQEVKEAKQIKKEHGSSSNTDVKVESKKNSPSSNSTKRQKHIRPGGSGRPFKRQCFNHDTDTDPYPDVSLSSNTDTSLLNSLDMTLPEEYKPYNKSTAMQSYHQWSHETLWYRSMKQIGHSCNISEMVIIDYYRKEIYPRRVDLLKYLQDLKYDNDANETKVNVLFSNFASVSRLMVTAKK
jgi:hypothetical protein